MSEGGLSVNPADLGKGVFYTEKSKEDRINEEFERLTAIYSDIPANQFTLLLPTIQNAAFMKVTLDDLQVTINANGCSEHYQNGENQGGQKASADLQAYNSVMKNYISVIDKLSKALPVGERAKSKLSAFMDD